MEVVGQGGGALRLLAKHAEKRVACEWFGDDWV